MEKDLYSEFRKTTEESVSQEGKKEKLMREFELIESRGWEKYAVALSRIFKSVKKNLMNVDISGTASDLATLSGEGKDDLCFSDKSLNASFYFTWPFVEMIERDSHKLICIISRNLRGLDLYTKKCDLSEEFDERRIVILISKKPIDKKSFDLVVDNVKNNRDNNPSMMDYLLLTINASLGLSLDL